MNITELCVNCKQNKFCTMCWKTSNKECPHFIQKTNADRIRAMTDEELAKGLADCAIGLYGDTRKKGLAELPESVKREVFDSLLEWLKQPTE